MRFLDICIQGIQYLQNNMIKLNSTILLVYVLTPFRSSPQRWLCLRWTVHIYHNIGWFHSWSHRVPYKNHFGLWADATVAHLAACSRRKCNQAGHGSHYDHYTRSPSKVHQPKVLQQTKIMQNMIIWLSTVSFFEKIPNFSEFYMWTFINWNGTIIYKYSKTRKCFKYVMLVYRSRWLLFEQRDGE